MMFYFIDLIDSFISFVFVFILALICLKFVSPRLFFNCKCYLLLPSLHLSTKAILSFLRLLFLSFFFFIFISSFSFDFYYIKLSLFFGLVFFILNSLWQLKTIDFWFVYKCWYRRFYRFFFFVLNYSVNFEVFFDTVCIVFARLRYFFFSLYPYKARSTASIYTVTIRWKNVIIFSLFDQDFRSLIQSFQQHFDSLYYFYANFAFNIERTPRFVSSKRECLSHPGNIALYNLFDELDVQDAIHQSHLEAYENDIPRNLYTYDLDLSKYFISLEDLKYFLLLLDWSIILNEPCPSASAVHHVRLSLINLIYNGYYTYFVHWVKSLLFFTIPFRQYYFLFVILFFSLILHFILVFINFNAIFIMVCMILLGDVIWEFDFTNFWRHLFFALSIFSFGFLGFFFIFIELVYFFFTFFNEKWFYRPFECNYPFPHYLNKYIG